MENQSTGFLNISFLCLVFFSSPSYLHSNSAESVAMGLLRQFEGMQLPAASELDWLVPEHDAPQKVRRLSRVASLHTWPLTPSNLRKLKTQSLYFSQRKRPFLNFDLAVFQLLPIPDSLPISPDDGEHADIYKLRIRVRGNLEWAPPRPQIIFNIHPAPK